MKSPFLHPMIPVLAAFALAPALLGVAPHAAAAEDFARPAGLEPDVRFWKRIYSEVDTQGGLIHDSRDLGVVYEVVQFSAGMSHRSRERHTEGIKKRYKRILRSLASGKRSGLTGDEKRVLGLFPEGVSNSTLRQAGHRLRFQLGQADKFRAGLIRAGAWEPHIRETLNDMGLPEKLAALPHVESSYTPTAYSRVGAAGLWQFTRSTGRRFLRVDHVVDERLDPHRATVAAARLLKQNYTSTGTWPLAITSYNHGASGMRRAKRKMGTSDIEKIVRGYKSRTFGFASRNFYVEFLAAAEIDYHAERYFGKLRVDTPIAYESVEVPYYVHAAPLQRALGVDLGILKEANPSLRSSVWNGTKRVPKGFEIKVPRAMLAKPLAQGIAAVPREHQKTAQTRDKHHIVRRGDTLSGIAARYGLSVSEIASINGLRSRNRIRAGQKLRLPVDGVDRGASTSYKVASRPPTTKPPVNGIYTVRRGETLSRIAKRFGLSEAELVEMNGLTNRHRIQAGQSLIVDAAFNDMARDGEDPHPQAVIALTSPRDVERGGALAPEPKAVESEEPVEADASPSVGVAPPAEAQRYGPELLADPSDYSVSSEGIIEVQAAETLGHYAEWLGVRASRLRQINHMRYGQPLVIGKSLRLDFANMTPQEFEAQRLNHHRLLQGEFFEQYEIEGTRTHVARRGDSIWQLANRKYRVPLWLLRQYNPDIDFGSLSSGTELTIPSLKKRAEWSG